MAHACMYKSLTYKTSHLDVFIGSGTWMHVYGSGGKSHFNFHPFFLGRDEETRCLKKCQWGVGGMERKVKLDNRGGGRVVGKGLDMCDVRKNNL